MGEPAERETLFTDGVSRNTFKVAPEAVSHNIVQFELAAFHVLLHL